MDGGRPFRVLKDRAGDKLTQQHSVVKTIRFSPNEALPAEAFRGPLLARINKAMENLNETNSQGIVLLVGGTGCGKIKRFSSCLVCGHDRPRLWQGPEKEAFLAI
eukprot:757302-Amphidinium_carterae.2